MATVADSKAGLQRSLGEALRTHLPQTAGYEVKVEILENGRKKRSDASRESWQASLGEIRITFGSRVGASSAHSRAKAAPGGSENQRQDRSASANQRDDLVRSLERAERRPGFDFIALKWFRDVFLPEEGHTWASSSRARDEALRGAIQDGIILTSKVPNPRTPTFPVTAIRLNRRHPDVLRILGESGTDMAAFRPIDIQGEPLSATVLRERR